MPYRLARRRARTAGDVFSRVRIKANTARVDGRDVRRSSAGCQTRRGDCTLRLVFTFNQQAANRRDNFKRLTQRETRRLDT